MDAGKADREAPTHRGGAWDTTNGCRRATRGDVCAGHRAARARDAVKAAVPHVDDRQQTGAPTQPGRRAGSTCHAVGHV